MRISDWSSDVCSSDLFRDAEDLADSGIARMIRRWPAITVHRPVLDNRHVIGAMKKHYPAIGDHIVGKPAVHAAAPGVMCPDRDQHVATDGIKTITDRKSTRLNSSH